MKSGDDMCQYCQGNEVYQYRIADSVFQIEIIKPTKSLGFHYDDSHFCLDYDNEEVKVNYCPFCGEKL